MEETKEERKAEQNTEVTSEEEPGKKKEKRHRILDRPVLGYFVIVVLASALIPVGQSVFAFLLEPFAADFANAAGLFATVLIFLGLYRLWFRPGFKGTLTFRGFGKGCLLLLVPVALGCALNVYESAQSGLTTEYGKALGLALCAGIGEEVIFRTMGISNFLRVKREEKDIPVILWISALTFALIHALNIIAGADVLMTVLQVISALGCGVLFGAVYIRTACIWPCILAHTLWDFTCFLSAVLLNSDGILNVSLTAMDAVSLLLTVPMFVIGIAATSKKHRQEILTVWNERWSRSTD